VVLPECPVTPAQVSDLRSILIGNRASQRAIADRRSSLAELYLDLLTAFVSRHTGNPGIRVLCRGEAARVARFFLLPSWPAGAQSILRRLTALEPLWPAQLMMDLLHGLLRRLRRRI
jgi:hypothetical protein